MKHDHTSAEHTIVLTCLSQLPKKIVQLICLNENHVHHVHELILREFSLPRCFNLERAAFFVDNPEFNCFKGVAGVSQQEKECCCDIDDVWGKPDYYGEQLRKSPFNCKVKGMESSSIVNSGKEHECLETIAHDLQMKHSDYCKWPMRHGNYGFLLFENNGQDKRALLDESVYLFSLCPLC